MDEAWSVFEQFFGGRDPFKDFDAFFEDPASVDFDRAFANLGQLGRQMPGGIAASGTSSSSQGIPSATQPSAVSSMAPLQRTTMVRCLGRHGVAWRRSMNLADRLEHVRGPEWGDILAVGLEPGGWVRGIDGWLPLAIDGERLFEILDCPQPWTVRCLSAQGVAYRRSMDLGDRVEGVRGPDRGAVLPLEELRAGWVRAAAGWLPLEVGGAEVLEVLRGAAPGARSGGAQSGGGWGGTSWGVWSLLVPSLPYRLLTVMGASCYVSLRVARVLFRGWWNMWFGFLPYFWR